MPKSNAFSASSRQRVEIKVRPHRSLWVQLLLIPWRWRTELVVGVLFFVACLFLSQVMPFWLAYLLLVSPLAIGPVRRFVVARLWCLVTRHRLRSFCAETGVTSRSGRLPWLLWVRPTPVGERVWLWMVTGLSIEDVENRTKTIASTCWAREARVETVRSLSTLVVVDIIRRDPLDRGTVVSSLLAKTAGFGRSNQAESPSDAGAAEAPVFSNVTPLRSVKPTKVSSRSSSKSSQSTTSNTVLVNGEDVSDYVD